MTTKTDIVAMVAQNHLNSTTNWHNPKNELDPQTGKMTPSPKIVARIQSIPHVPYVGSRDTQRRVAMKLLVTQIGGKILAIIE